MTHSLPHARARRGRFGRRAPAWFTLALLACGCAHRSPRPSELPVHNLVDVDGRRVGDADADTWTTWTVQPTNGTGALQLSLASPPNSGFAQLCRELTDFANVPQAPEPRDVARVQNALTSLGYFSHVSCSVRAGGAQAANTGDSADATPSAPGGAAAAKGGGQTVPDSAAASPAITSPPPAPAMACKLEPAPIVRSVHFSGHVPFALLRDDLRRRLSLRPGTVLMDVPAQLQDQAQRLQNYLHQEGYFDAAVAITPRPAAGAWPHRGLHLDVAVTARQTAFVRHVELRGEVPIATQKLAKRFFHRGFLFYVGRFRPMQLATDVEEATVALQDAGFVGARIQASYTHDAAARAIDIVLQVRPGPRVRLRLEGEPLLSMRSIRRLAPFADSGAVDSVAVEDFRQRVLRRLQELGYPEASVAARMSADFAPHTRVVTLSLAQGSCGRLPLQRIRVLGAQRVPAATLLKDTALLQSVGTRHRPRPYVSAYVEHDVLALQATLHRAGFASARVSAQQATYAQAPDATSTRASVQTRQQTSAPARDQGREQAGTPTSEKAPAPSWHTQLLLRIEEGPRTTTGDVVLRASVDSKTQRQLSRAVRLHSGVAWLAQAVEDDVQALQLALSKRGYIDAQVHADSTPRAPATLADAAATTRAHPHDSVVDVTYTVTPGAQAQLRGIFLRGNFRTRAATMRQTMDLKLQAPINLVDVGQAKRALRGTSLFDAVQLAPKKAQPTDANTWLLLAVEERDTRAVDGVASFSSDYAFALGADYRDDNLFGRAVQLTVSTRLADAARRVPYLHIGNRDFIEARLRAPKPFGLPLITEGSALYDDRHLSEYRARNIRAQVAVLRTFFARRRCKLCPSLTLRLGYEIEESYLENNDTLGAANDGDQARPATIAALVPSLGLDARDSATDPRRGYNVEVQLKGANPVLAGVLERRASAFWRLQVGAQIFVPLGTPLRIALRPHRALGGPWVLAMAATYGAAGPYGARGAVPRSQTFGFGGDMDVRGLRNRASNALVAYADYMLTASCELRWYVLEDVGFGSVQLAGFVDVGAVSGTLDRLGHGSVVSAGPALRYVTPVGPLSLAYGRALVLPSALRHDPGRGAPHGGRIHFTFGYTF